MDSNAIVEAWVGEDSCPICLSDEIDNKIETKCRHTFCNDCLNEWIRLDNTCPICRQHSPIKTPTKLLDIRCQRLLGPLVNFKVDGLKNNLCMRLIKGKNCFLTINGKFLRIKTQFGLTILKTKVNTVRHVKPEDNKITIAYVSSGTKGMGLCRHKKEINENELTFNISSNHLAEEIVDTMKEWFTAAQIYAQELAENSQQRTSISLSSYSSYRSY
jgi:hypothetical protein